MNAANRDPLNAPPLSVTSLILPEFPCDRVGELLGQRDPAGEPFGLGDSDLDGRDGITGVAGGSQMPPEFILREIVRASGDPPHPAGCGLELRKVQLPHPIWSRRRIDERLTRLGQPPLALVFHRLQQIPPPRRTLHSGC
ncbi:hypothetical protein [Saccharopolyspora hattusasensis]|uniref:hypothetical protein n=1 Tax=Saccharopolyspora hattusasensis TaxID=1128679 RepID=UPI003D974649